MTLIPPDKTLLLWRIRLLAAVCVFFVLHALFLRPNLILAVCLGVFSSVLQLWYLPRFFKGLSITVYDGCVEIISGVLLRKRRKTALRMPIYTISSPLARTFGYSAVYLRVANGIVLLPEIKNCDIKLLLAEAKKT